MNYAVIFNRSRVRVGRISLSQHAFFRMQEYGLTTEVLEDVFRYGQEVEAQKIVQQYDKFSVGLLYALDETRVFRGNLADEVYVIITCWRGSGVRYA